MKNKFAFIKLTSMLLALLLVISGCSSGNDKESSDGGKVKLKMSVWGNPVEIDGYKLAIDLYKEENPNVEITIIPVPSDSYEQKLFTELSGGNPSDIFYAGDTYISKLIETGKVVDLTDFLESNDSYVKADEFAEGLWGGAKKDDKIFGVPVDSNPFLMYYNKNVLKEAGIEKTPQEYFDEGQWNWDTFSEMTGELVAAGKKGYVGSSGGVYTLSWVWSNGGELYDDNGNIILDKNEKARETFRYLEGLIEDGKITYSGSLPKGQGADALFMSNQVGFLSAGRWLTPMFSENDSLDFDYIPWPTNTGEKMEPAAIGTAYMSVSKDSKHVDEAKKFLSFYTSTVGQKARLAENGSAIPSVNGIDDLVEEAKVPEHATYLLDARNIGIVDDKQMSVPGLDKELRDIVDLMYLGQQDADKTMDEFYKKAKEMIEDYRK
ncbi:sugar ABC transporter substrate-binding protein [Sporosarcina sp. ANT_H38]|uniref:ABC transporter substrate-binding protein n=1 Tax=Sporosarcina sp. ANT_H38 TaxID=2597358 RepID=UPI0011F16C23|nr:sugar ABC transporter substrate-binding protein [Sporosarcina sp. ANT_H38]KAA0965569.1 sugar ABC transporter substrate-binding protein [Sporosarcina sp. ANT_H38]